MSAIEKTPLGYGLVGCGGFGLFRLEQYASLNDMRVVAVADADAGAAAAASRASGAEACSVDELLRHRDVSIVHIATPPFTHRRLVEQALGAGKHVLCEKPLATSIEDARAMVDAAAAAGRILAVNLIMRYDPLCAAVKEITQGNVLGEPLHAYFENYAKDEPLLPDHWFWNKEKSGGIFIEHAVHFFDLFEWWFGAGRVVSAEQAVRPGIEAVEQVTCTARYGPTVIGQFYHSFTQASRMDRQELRVVYEMGSITMEEWVPSRMHVDAIVSAETLERLQGILFGARTHIVEEYDGAERQAMSRHQTRHVDCRVSMEYDVGMPKLELYGMIIRDLMADQIAAIRDASHARRITEINGLTSLAYASEADAIAQRQHEGVQ